MIWLTSCYTKHDFVADYAACDKVTSPPSNGLFQVGSTFVLSCSVDGLSAGNVLQWTEYQTTTTGNNICTVSTVGTSCDPKYPRYKLESSQGWHNLTISNAVIADGGTYKCWFVLGQNPPVSDAQVVIFGQYWLSHFSFLTKIRSEFIIIVWVDKIASI